MKQDIVKELQSDPNVIAECVCGEHFRLRDAVLFYADAPMPDEVSAVIEQRRTSLAQRKKDLRIQRSKLKVRSEVATVSINLGKILEKVAPVLSGYQFDARDSRALFEPIDYIVFSGLTRGDGNVELLSFLDIKTGGSGLNLHQRQVRAVIEAGKVCWKEYRGSHE